MQLDSIFVYSTVQYTYCVHSVFLQFILWVCVLQPVFVDGHRIYVPVLVEGDGLLRGDQCLRVVIGSGLKYQEQVIWNI